MTDRSDYYRQRRAALRGGPARAPEPCPSYAAYRRHQRNGEEPCAGCREKYNEHQREMYRQRKS